MSEEINKEQEEKVETNSKPDNTESDSESKPKSETKKKTRRRKTTKKSTSKKTPSKKKVEEKPKPKYKILQEKLKGKNIILFYDNRPVYKGDSKAVSWSKNGATVRGVTYKFDKLNIKEK